MSQLQYLNLDELTPEPTRALMLGGIEHPIVEQTVDGFIQASALIKQMQALPETDYAGQVQITVKLIKLSVPSIDESALGARPLAALRKIQEFIRGEQEVAEEPADSDVKK